MLTIIVSVFVLTLMVYYRTIETGWHMHPMFLHLPLALHLSHRRTQCLLLNANDRGHGHDRWNEYENANANANANGSECDCVPGLYLA